MCVYIFIYLTFWMLYVWGFLKEIIRLKTFMIPLRILLGLKKPYSIFFKGLLSCSIFWSMYTVASKWFVTQLFDK